MRKVRIIIFGLLLFIMCSSINNIKADQIHKRIKTANAKKWEKAYARKILDTKNAEGFFVVKMDQGKIPVLVLEVGKSSNGYNSLIFYFYKYKKGKIVKIGKHKQKMADINVYRHKKTVIFDEYACNSATYICKMKKGKIKKTIYYAAARQEKPYGIDYYKGNKKISEKKYYKEVKKTKEAKIWNADWFCVQVKLLHQKSDL